VNLKQFPLIITISKLEFFSDKNKSNELISQIKSVGIECLMDEIAKDKQNLYLVKTTIYNNYSEAEAALDVLKNNKFSGIIKKK